MAAVLLAPSALSQELFEHEATIVFPDTDEVVIAIIDELDIGKDGNILITDRTSQAVLLFTSDGQFVRSLDPSSCHPGFHMAPISARFVGEEGILVINSGPWGHVFDIAGC